MPIRAQYKSENVWILSFLNLGATSMPGAVLAFQNGDLKVITDIENLKVDARMIK
jgi:hypothetical protein